MLTSSALADIIGTFRQHQDSPTTTALADINYCENHQHLPTLSAEPQFVASTQHYFSYNTDKQVVRTARGSADVTYCCEQSPFHCTKQQPSNSQCPPDSKPHFSIHVSIRHIQISTTYDRSAGSVGVTDMSQ